MTSERRARLDAIKNAMDDAVALGDLRANAGLTQVELAGRLGIRQASLSELERRDDVYLSTLRSYIEALGGELEVRAVFPEQQFVVDLAASTVTVPAHAATSARIPRPRSTIAAASGSPSK